MMAQYRSITSKMGEMFKVKRTNSLQMLDFSHSANCKSETNAMNFLIVTTLAKSNIY